MVGVEGCLRHVWSYSVAVRVCCVSDVLCIGVCMYMYMYVCMFDSVCLGMRSYIRAYVRT